jgi:hypothetical protein
VRRDAVASIVAAPYSTISQPLPSGSSGSLSASMPCARMSSTSTSSIASQAMGPVSITSGTWSAASKIEA